MITYIALLRGINISGKNKISMNELKIELAKTYKNVKTYLNSGNAIFESTINDKAIMKENIEDIIKIKFNLQIPIFIITKTELADLINNQPKWWGSDNKHIYDTIIFIIPPTTYKQVCATLKDPNEALETIYHYKNNIFYSYDLKNYRKTNWWSRTANTSIANKITIRTANTMKKKLELCNK